MNWSVSDFVIAGCLLGGLGFAIWFLLQSRVSLRYRLACALALFSGLALFWISGAVGIIGAASNDANLAYLGLIMLGAIAAMLTRFRPRALAWVSAGMMVGLIIVVMIAMAADLGVSGPKWPWDALVISTVFAGAFGVAAWLFKGAAQQALPR